MFWILLGVNSGINILVGLIEPDDDAEESFIKMGTTLISYLGIGFILIVGITEGIKRFNDWIKK